jgi:hypothetical protein
VIYLGTKVVYYHTHIKNHFLKRLNHFIINFFFIIKKILLMYVCSNTIHLYPWHDRLSLSHDCWNTHHALMASSTSCFLLEIPMWCFFSLSWGTPLPYLPCASISFHSFATSYFLIQLHPPMLLPLSRLRCGPLS